MATRSFRFFCCLSSNLLSHRYYIIAGSSTPHDTDTSEQESSSGDKEQNITVHEPRPRPDKHGSKDDVTCKLSRVHGLCGVFYINFSLCLSEQGGITVAYHPVNKMYLNLSLLTMEM